MPPLHIPGHRYPEEEYRRLAELGARLGLPVPQVFVKLEAHGPDGLLLARYEDRSRSITRNMWNRLAGQAASHTPTGATFGPGYLTHKQRSGTITNQPFTTNIAMVGGAGTTTTGILVGTGNTAESFDDYTLAAMVAHGNAAGQLNYQAQSATTASYNAGTKTWTLTLQRIMNNNSGGQIVVAEIGLYDYPSTSPVYLMARDVLDPTVPVANGAQLTGTYTVTITFPDP